MSDMLQYIVAGLIVAAATVYIVRRGWHLLRGRRSGCGSCSSCATPSVTVISPESLPGTASQDNERMD